MIGAIWMSPRILSSIALAALVAAFVSPAAAEGQRASASAAQQADVRFVGTILGTGSTFASVPQSPLNRIVEVDFVYGVGADVDLWRGDTVTVRLAEDDAALSPSTGVSFHANVWIMGEGLALRELDHSLSGEVGQAEDAAPYDLDPDLVARVAQATLAVDAVVIGPTRGLRLIAPEPRSGGGSAAYVPAPTGVPGEQFLLFPESVILDDEMGLRPGTEFFVEIPGIDPHVISKSARVFVLASHPEWRVTSAGIVVSLEPSDLLHVDRKTAVAIGRAVACRCK